MTTKTLVFIDSRIPEFEAIVASLSAGAEWFILGQDIDGMSQIVDVLDGYENLDSVQLISHGTPGTIFIGSAVLSSANLDDYSNELGALGSALSPDGDLLLYGCDVAKGDAGVLFLDSLAAATGADVAASNDATGSGALGGDWQLEERSGLVTTELLNVEGFSTLLATLTGGEGNDSITGTDNADVIDARGGDDTVHAGGGNDIVNAGAGDDMIFGEGGDDEIHGEEGNNTIFGEAGDDRIIGLTNEGNDKVYGGDGKDLIWGNGGTDFIDGGNEDDVITANSGSINGGEGDDQIEGGRNGGVVEINGGAGNDYIEGFISTALIDGEQGNDFIYFGTGGSSPLSIPSIAGGDGFDILELNMSEGATANISSASVFGIEEIRVRSKEATLVIDDGLHSGDTYFNISMAIGYAWTNANAASHVVFGASYGALSLDASAETDGRLEVHTCQIDDEDNILHDNIRTGSLGDKIYMYDGNDIAEGGGGNDFIDGGDGVDVAVYSGNFSDYTIAEVTYNTFRVADNRGIDGTDTIVDVNVLRFADGDQAVEIKGLMIVGDDTDDVITGGAYSDYLAGAGGNDVISGDAGNDSVFGGSGTDMLEGSNGDDFVYGNDGQDNVIGGTGNDYLSGDDGSDYLYGGSGDDEVYGGMGDDTIVGGNGAGSDAYFGGIGIDTVNYTSAMHSISVDLSLGTASGEDIGDDSLSLIENVVGGSGNDMLSGDSNSNYLTGGIGDDTLVGNAGNDFYLVDADGDVVTENANEGTDIVSTGIAYILGANMENLILTGSGNVNGTGNTLNNTLTGNSGANVLDGGLGDDTFIGGAGNDTYVVDVAGDVVTENGNEGTDTVSASITYSLGTNLENLILVGSGNVNGTGNTLNNTLTGNSGTNTLDGGAGSDTLIGGAGNDTYLVDAVEDVVTENANEGVDTISTTVTVTLASEIENVALTGLLAIDGTGNSLSNDLAGNDASNKLVGKAGDDSLTGNKGSDTLSGGGGADVLLGSGGKDTLKGGGGEDTLSGNGGADTINGGKGVDDLTGDAGRDVFIFNTSLGSDNVDTIYGFSHADDTIHLDDDIFKSLAAGSNHTLASAQYKENASGAATDADDRIIYNNSTGDLYYDADGTGPVAAVKFAVINGGPDEVDQTDFVVVI